MVYKKINPWLIASLILFALIYAAISLVNHYNFRTYALDLGLYTNALYDYIHFQWNDSTLFKAEAENLLADHFDLYLIIFSPLSLIFGTYTLLIIQIIAAITGALGIYRYFRLLYADQGLPMLALVHFMIFFGIFSAIAYDYHSNVVAAMLVPWFFVYLRKEKFLQSSLIFILVLIAKENMSLWMLFICLALLIEYRKQKKYRVYLAALSVTSLAYFIMIIGIVMPAISVDGIYPHFHYSVLGDGPVEAVKYIFTHPLKVIRYLFINHTLNPEWDFVKAEFHVFILLSGLPFLFFKPRYLLMLIPLYFQKMYHDHTGLWSIAGQYSVEFAPVLTIGVFTVIREIRSAKWIRILAVFAIITSLAATVRLMDNTVYFTNKSMIRIYQKSHYTRDYNVNSAYRALKLIPPDAMVSAQSPFVPHLALRDKIYQFPIIKDAEYIVFSFHEAPYPLPEEKFSEITRQLINSDNWKVMYAGEGMFVLAEIDQGIHSHYSFFNY